MGFVRAEEKAEGAVRGNGITHHLKNLRVSPSVHFTHFPIARVGKLIDVFEGKDGFRFDVSLARQHHPVIFPAQEVRNASDVFVGPRMVGVGSVPYGMNSRVKGMAGGRTHGCGLITSRESHSLLGQSKDMRSFGRTSIDFHIQVGAVIGKNEYEVRFFGSLANPPTCKGQEYENQIKNHGHRAKR